MKCNIKIAIITILAAICFVQDVSATHIVGGDLGYRHIGGDNYEITLTVRRDCFTGDPDADFDNPAKLYFYKENGALAGVGVGLSGILNMNFNPDDTLGNTFISDCGFEGEQVCVQETQYVDTIRLPFLEGGYTIAYVRCCRNPTIQNIIDPAGTGTTWWTQITEESLLQNNSSPQFEQWPEIYICANENIDFDHSAIDVDGDSLVYRLYTPYTGASQASPIPNTTDTRPPYERIVWATANGFDLDNVLGSAVPLTIDPQTGVIAGIPDFIGQYVVGVAVDEYRDGELIGTTRRDFQYNVRVCSDPPTGDFAANDGDCDGVEVQFTNTSLGGTEFAWNFNYPSTDPVFLSNEENPFFVYPEAGVYDVQLIVTRGTDICRDEVIRQISAIESSLDVQYDLNVTSCNPGGGYTITLTDQSIEPEVGFDVTGREWTITQAGFDQVFTTPTVIIDVLPEDFTVELQVSSGTGCSKTNIDTIDIDDLLAVTEFELELAGCSDAETALITLTDVSDDLNIFDSPQGFSWEVATSAGTEMGNTNPYEVAVPDNGTITVTLVTDFGGGCTATVTRDFDMEEVVPQAAYDLIAEGCPDDNSVDVSFVSSADEDNPDYAVASTAWSITVAGVTSTSSMDSFFLNIPKDSLVQVELTVTFDNGCVDVVSESVVPGPFVTIEYTRGDPFLICSDEQVPLLVDPNPGFTYMWSTEDGLDLSDPTNPILVATDDRTYYVTVTDGLCSLEDSLQVVVLDEDNLSIAGDSITCDGSVQLTASGGILEGDFVWATDPSFSDTIFVGNILTTSFTGLSQTYYASFTGIDCGDAFAEYTVSLSEVFAVEFAGDPVRVCVGDTVALLSNYNSGLTYEWSPLTDLIFFNGNTSDAYVAGIADGEYSVNISDDFCDFDTTVLVEISDIQQLSIVGDSVLCTDTVSLTVSGAIGNGDYEWASDSLFTNVIATGAELETVIDGLTDTFYVRFTDPTCGDEVFSYSVRRYLFDLVYFEQWTICPGDTVNFPLINLGEDDLTYQWDEDIHIITDSDQASPLVGTGVDEADPFTLYFTATSIHGCTFSDSIVVLFTENPTIEAQYELQECGDFTVCFSIVGDVSGFPSWDFGDPTVDDDTSFEETPCYTYSQPGVYDVTVSNITAICPFVPDTISVTVNDDITIDPIAEQIACLGDPVSVTATTPDSNVSFVWCNSDGDTIAIGADVDVIADSSYQIIVKGTDVNGCSSQQAVDITVVTFDIVDNIGPVLCDGQETFIELTVNGGTDGYSFDWGDDECIVSGGDTANPIILATGAKTFGVTITDLATGCVDSMSYDVTVTSFGITAEAAPDTVINPGESTDIFVIDPMDDYSYEWSNGSDDEEQTVSPEESITYTVTVTDELGCTATADVFVRVRIPQCDESDVYLPNAFSPNGDNVNDVLFVRSNFIDELTLIIYNRWGEEVFRTTDPNSGWDGTLNGEELPPDAFAYYMDVLCINGVRYSKQGNVSLLK